MKNLFLLTILTASVFSFGQPTCQLKHQFWDDLTLSNLRSGDENLRSDTVNVINYSAYLDFTQGQSGILKAHCEVKFEAIMDINTLSLDLLQLNVDSIVFQGSPIAFNYNDTLIVADLGGTMTSGSIDSITVYYNGTPQTDPSGWGGFYMNSSYYYNLGVGFEAIPHNFGRVWHPCFDNFVERATYDFEVLTNNNFTAYCNGTQTGVTSVGTDSLLTTWELSTEIPTYLASVAVSHYTHVSDPYFSISQGITIPVWLAAQESDTTNLKNSFANLHAALAAYEQHYGPYVWERIGYVLVPFTAGAMEHATNIAYPQLTANGLLTYETLMAHELSHHWWGDWVTCATAEEMWINEGMAVYSEFLFLENVYDWDTYMEEMRTNHHEVLHRAHIDDSGFYALNAVPLKYTYGNHSYQKGADVMHTLRGYLGDANFFTGLQTVQNTYGGSHCSSEQFRDAINTLAGVDVNDFFDAWILQPGFAAFEITDMTITPNGSDYNVQIIVDQKLKGASSYHNNVPLTVTFMDANWNEHTEQFFMSGDFAAFNFTIPIEPVFAALNMDEKINHGVTAVAETINATGINDWEYANCRLSVNSVTDSAFVRVAHHWVYADDLTNLPNVVISKDRYWTVNGIGIEQIDGYLRFEFNAQNNANGDLDNSILFDVGGQPFTEDSVVLLYRPDAQSNWEIHSNYTLNYAGTSTDKRGFLRAEVVQAGQYTIGYKVASIGISENKKSTDRTYSIYPNPATDSIFIDLSEWETNKYGVEIFAINGDKVQKNHLNGGEVNTISIDQLIPGTYLFIITDNDNKRLGSKRVVIN